MSNILDLRWGPTFCGASSESKLFAFMFVIIGLPKLAASRKRVDKVKPKYSDILTSSSTCYVQNTNIIFCYDVLWECISENMRKNLKYVFLELNYLNFGCTGYFLNPCLNLQDMLIITTSFLNIFFRKKSFHTQSAVNCFPIFREGTW